MACNGATYRGFSIENYINNKELVLTDKELVKKDLLSHIFTSKGERLMMPTFGTELPSLLFEPLDEITVATAQNSIIEAINYDPRVQLVNISAVPDFDTGSLTVSATIEYIELESVAETLDITLQFGAG